MFILYIVLVYTPSGSGDADEGFAAGIEECSRMWRAMGAIHPFPGQLQISPLSSPPKIYPHIDHNLMICALVLTTLQEEYEMLDIGVLEPVSGMSPLFDSSARFPP